MKRYLFLFILFFSMACKKDKTVAMNERLDGKWKFINSKGGFSGQDVISAPAGVTNYLVLSKDFNYQLLSNDAVEKSGKYTLKTGVSDYLNEKADFINFDGDLSPKTYVIKGDSLLISDDHYEPYHTLYTKAH
ncbi:hypothetical protein AAFN85_30460 [Mucilaginibacter sp. CAU 1740]|uniref:hypothetical protein n=1 Tax=Mucilaginibacter sp. CAU 1740 TaxID=3140365 RepID=UPI00325A637A